MPAAELQILERKARNFVMILYSSVHTVKPAAMNSDCGHSKALLAPFSVNIYLDL